jgi:hypothetical protein
MLETIIEADETEFLNFSEKDLFELWLMECQLCGNVSKDQRTLRCGHSFCVKCLQSRIEVSHDSNAADCVDCAACGSQTVLDKDIQSLPMDPLVALYSAVPTQRAQSSCVEPSIYYCDTCDPENRQESSHKCVECNDWLCSVCASFHKRTKLTRDHMILTMDDVESGKHTTDVKNRAKIFCMVHPTEESRAFCAVCDVCFCHYCDEHSNHKQIGIRDAIFQKTTDFESILADVHRRAEVLRAEVHHMKRIKEQLMNEKSRCITDIKDLAQGKD